MFTNKKFYENSFGGCRFVSCGRTDMDRYGEANYCAVDGAGYLECVTVVGRWSARVGCVVDSSVCLQTSFC
jgi:hypothetical protein